MVPVERDHRTVDRHARRLSSVVELAACHGRSVVDLQLLHGRHKRPQHRIENGLGRGVAINSLTHAVDEGRAQGPAEGVPS